MRYLKIVNNVSSTVEHSTASSSDVDVDVDVNTDADTDTDGDAVADTDTDTDTDANVVVSAALCSQLQFAVELRRRRSSLPTLRLDRRPPRLCGAVRCGVRQNVKK
ncbi:mRNA 3'-end-processing protein RNA14-like [Drosophila grimshawi]|uniref:mRNA 3'-end-processing protein RNA14-like n=1 Tax=Drosophila grimshawi TaxID=7222 RepID=UPI001C933319|nr:mRNA 3'-end-processing protein RNA14-like [Drosophila grimshawi]